MNGRLLSADRYKGPALLATGLVCSLTALSTAGMAQNSSLIEGSDYDRSGWVGAAFFEPPLGRFDNCRQGHAFDNGTILTFSLDAAGFVDVGLVDETWSREPGTAVPTAARLDDYGPVDLAGVVDSPTAISFPLGDNPQIIDAFRRGYIFEIVGEDFGPLSYELTGTSGSLSSLRNCVSTYREIALTPTLGETGRRIAFALSDYPEDIRRAVLEATLYPDVIRQIAEIQAGSSDAFRAVVDGEPRDTQNLVWRVVRYPDLVDAIVQNGQATDGDYPQSAIEAGQTLIDDHPDLIERVQTIRVEAEQEVAQLLSDQPPSVEATFRILVEYPEIMAGMADDLPTVERGGELWSEDSDAVWQAMELTIAEIREADDAALASWEDQIASNPQAADEMIEAADAYVAEMSASNPTYAALNTDPELYSDPAYAADAYPYWYGPPPQGTDYAPASWYPTPYYDDSGFTLSDAGELIFTGLVSVAFISWLFDEIDDDDDYWWGRYPHYSEQIFINVEDNIIIIGDVSEIVDDWRDERERYLPDDWFDDDGRLADRLEELGEFERDFTLEADRRGQDDFDRGEFLSENEGEFPRLQEAGIRDRSEAPSRLAAPDGVDRDLTGLAGRLDGGSADGARPAQTGELNIRDLPALQAGPNGGTAPSRDPQALEQQLGTPLAERLTGGGGQAGGTVRPDTPPVSSQPAGGQAIARNPDRTPFDQFNGSQLGFAPRTGQAPATGGIASRQEAPRTVYQPTAPNLPRGGGRQVNRPSGGSVQWNGGGNFQRRF